MRPGPIDATLPQPVDEQRRHPGGPVDGIGGPGGDVLDVQNAVGTAGGRDDTVKNRVFR